MGIDYGFALFEAERRRAENERLLREQIAPRDIAGMASAQQAEINRIRRDPRYPFHWRTKLYTSEEVEALKKRKQTKEGNQDIEQELQGEVDMWLGELTRDA